MSASASVLTSSYQRLHATACRRRAGTVHDVVVALPISICFQLAERASSHDRQTHARRHAPLAMSHLGMHWTSTGQAK